MRDLFAGVVALVLLVVAASLGTTLTAFRRRRLRARDSERALGRRILAEIPAHDDLRLFSEDAVRFHYCDVSVDKDLIVRGPCADQRIADRRVPVDTTSRRQRPSGDQLRGSAGRASQRH